MEQQAHGYCIIASLKESGNITKLSDEMRRYHDCCFVLVLLSLYWLQTANGVNENTTANAYENKSLNWLDAVLAFLFSFFQFPCGFFPPHRCGILNIGVVLHKGGPVDDGCEEICSFTVGLDLPEYQCGPCKTPEPPTPTPPPTPSSCQSTTSSTLDEGEQLYSDREPHYLCSPNHKYRFGLSSDNDDSDLALWERRESDNGNGYYSKIWSAFLFDDAAVVGGVRLRLQSDGNLVVRRNSDGQAVWSSKSTGSPLSSGNTLSIEDEGKASLYRIDDAASSMQVTWQSFRCGVWGARPDEETIVDSVVDATTVHGKIMAGYQGWFDTSCSDRGRWTKWSSSGADNHNPNRTNYQFEMWPDLSEFTASDNLCDTDFQYRDGTRASLFSSLNAATVDRHFRWMYEYGMDGVYLQRFFTSDRCFNTAVLDNVRRGAERYGRTFAYMFDVSDSDESTLYQQLRDEWKFLVDHQQITKSSRYLHHNGKPVLSIWGFGIEGRPGTPASVESLLRWFQSEAEERYQVTVMGGVASLSWQNNTAWQNVFRMFDIISPWTVGRYHNNAEADVYRTKYMEPNLKECSQLGIDYMPVVWPGFSWSYRTIRNPTEDSPFNEIPRQGGNFLWRQLHNSVSIFPNPSQAQVYVAMFDEVNEGTAVFKVTATQEETPVSIDNADNIFLALDADAPTYTNVPSDWYMRLLGTATTLLRQNRQVPLQMPTNPMQPRNLVVRNFNDEQ